MQRITLTTVSSSIICTRRNADLGCCCGKSSQLYIRIPYNTLCSLPNCTFQRSFQKITYAIIFSDDKKLSKPFLFVTGLEMSFPSAPETNRPRLGCKRLLKLPSPMCKAAAGMSSFNWIVNKQVIVSGKKNVRAAIIQGFASPSYWLSLEVTLFRQQTAQISARWW